jgi:anti-sigma regulatory factor (Ser/Thr protein kinase)
VPLADDLSLARASLEQRPAQLHRHCDLPSHFDALAVARLFVGQTCALWTVPVVLEQRAELVCGQLVANAVEHAQSTSRLTLTWTAAALTVSVRDYRATPVPHTRPIDLHALGGRGMHLVTAVAHCWGAHQHPDGNTIWVNLVCQRPKGTSRRPTQQTYPTVSKPARR